MGVGSHMVFYSRDSSEWYIGSLENPALFVEGVAPAGRMLSHVLEPPLVGWMPTHSDVETSADLFFSPKNAWGLLVKKSQAAKLADHHSSMDALL